VKPLAVCAAIILFASCSKPSAAPGAQSAAENALAVVASFYTMADFAQKIGGERVSVHTLIPPGQEAHDWEPSPRDIAALESAAVFIYNGAGLEPWAHDVLASLSNKRLAVIEASAGIPLIPGDPHVWLSPLGAKTELLNIANGLYAADPLYSAEYTAAYERYASACDELHAQYITALASFRGMPFITAHAAFGYLAREYSLVQTGMSGASDEDEPSPLAMKRLIDYGRAHGITTVFYGEAGQKKIAEALAREIGARTAFLHPLEVLSLKEIAAGDDYFSVMKQNLAALNAAFGAE
jgi:zinc transport system substrate-binding protein